MQTLLFKNGENKLEGTKGKIWRISKPSRREANLGLQENIS